MLLVSLLYVVTWTPGQIYVLLVHVNSQLTAYEYGFFIILGVGFLYSCTNPFIYAIHFDPVKRVLLGLIPCNDVNSQQCQCQGQDR